MAYIREKIDHCPNCNTVIKRTEFQGLNEWRNCELCGRKLSISGDLTKRIELVVIRVGDGVTVPNWALPHVDLPFIAYAQDLDARGLLPSLFRRVF